MSKTAVSLGPTARDTDASGQGPGSGVRALTPGGTSGAADNVWITL